MIMAFITASFPQHASLTRSTNTRSSLPAVNSCPKWSQAGTLMRSRCHHGVTGTRDHIYAAAITLDEAAQA
jgi:hypothetical protein